jgi:Tol biopolymer transport system component
VVGDDAINRSIAKVRALAEIATTPAFEIETVPRVGYRLREFAVAPAPAVAVRGTNIYWIAGGATALLGLAAVFAVTFWPRAPRWEIEHSQVLISTALIESHPAISPDGKMLAYSAGSDANSRRIYVRRIAGGEPLKLTDGANDAASPSWAPDGGSIAYTTYKEGEPCRVMVTSVPAGPARQIGRCKTEERAQVLWSRAGRELYLRDRPDHHSPARLFRIDLETGRRSEVTHPAAGAEGEQSFSLSPDQRSVSFTRDADRTTASIWVADLQSGVERLVVGNGPFTNGTWTEDSATLLLISNGGAGDYGIWSVPVSGGAPRQLMANTGEIFRLASGPGGMLATETPVSKSEVRMVSLRGGNGTVIEAAAQGQLSVPALTRDGAVTYAGNRYGEFGIWSRARDGRTTKIVALKPFADSAFVGYIWSPDGSKIAYVPPSESPQTLRVVDRAGIPIATGKFAGRDLGGIAWTPDGRAMLFAQRDARGWRIWKMTLADPSHPVALTGYGFLAPFTDDQSEFAVRSDAGGVWRLGDHPVRLTAGPTPEHWGDVLIRDGEIFYVEYPHGRAPRLVAQPIAGGALHPVADMPDYAAGLGWDCDREAGVLVYSASRDDRDIGLLRLVRK